MLKYNLFLAKYQIMTTRFIAVTEKFLQCCWSVVFGEPDSSGDWCAVKSPLLHELLMR